jgi:hypothetical protein
MNLNNRFYCLQAAAGARLAISKGTPYFLQDQNNRHCREWCRRARSLPKPNLP